MKIYLKFTGTFVLTIAILLCCYRDIAFCRQKKITVVFGNGDSVESNNWTFVYHATRRNTVLPKGSSHPILEKSSQNLYLVERYDGKEGKTGAGREKEINIDCKNLSSIEYLWNWNWGNAEKVVIILTDGTKFERLRLGPIAVSFFDDTKLLYGEGIYLECDYSVNNKGKHLKYNLNKWRKGLTPEKDIIKKIIFQ